MKNKSIYEFRDYKAYLRFLESHRPQGSRGFRAELSRTVGCQTAYTSQVLNGSANFSLEQAQVLNEWLAHDKNESRYFLFAIDYARAGTALLRANYLELMEELIQKQLNLKERFKVKEMLSSEDQAVYYGHWAYAAMHMAVTVPQLQTPEAISDFFRFPQARVNKVLKFLVSVGLVVNAKPNHYTIGTARLHLGVDSPLLPKHHVNWRLEAMKSLDREAESDLHYTSIVSLSQEDVLAIKALLVKEIDAYNAIVKPSVEETLCCLTLDFFELEKK